MVFAFDGDSTMTTFIGPYCAVGYYWMVLTTNYGVHAVMRVTLGIAGLLRQPKLFSHDYFPSQPAATRNAIS